MGRITKLIEKGADIKSIADQLSNNDEVTYEDLVELGNISDRQANKLITSWFKLSVRERNALSMDSDKISAWIEGII